MAADADDAAQHLARVQGLFVQHSPALRGFVLALVRDFALVDDVMQETFVQVTASAAQFRLGTSFTAWVQAIARYKVLEVRRKHAGRVQSLSPEVIDTLAACAPEPESDERRLRALEQCLQGLSPRAREAIQMRYGQAHKPAEIARRIGWTVEAVYVALSRARGVLRECVRGKLSEQRS